MSSKLPQGRHVDYELINAGAANRDLSVVIPTVASMPPETLCLDDKPEFIRSRIVDFVPTDTNSGTGIPIVAAAPKCCSAVSFSGRVEQDCWASSGIIQVMMIRLNNVNNCLSADGKGVRAYYTSGSLDNSGNIQWVAEKVVPLRGGSLQFYVSCQSGVAPGQPNKFRLTWRGCSSGEVFGPANCSDPLFLQFGQVISPLTTCCDCNNTVNSPTINVTAETNCYPDMIGRHVDYGLDGTPIIAEEGCSQAPTEPPGCGLMTCGVVAVITNVSDCACMEGTYPLPYTVAGFWTDTFAMCVGPATIRLTCETLFDAAGRTTGFVRLTMLITCGATNVGSDSVDIHRDDLEDLDVTFNIGMADPTYGVPCGDCTFQWFEMSPGFGFWVQQADNCTGSCSCVSAASIPPGSVDGEITIVPCPSGGTLSCCIGTISVRVTR